MVTTARSAPVGTMLDDGFSTKIAFAADPDVSFWEKTVQPPGVDGGEAVENTTMHNLVWRTMGTRQLKTLTDAATTVAYDPQVFDQIVALINVNGWITIHFPDASTLDFMGFLRSFEPSDNAEGEQPEATVNISPTNANSTGAETAPVYSS